MTRTTAIAASRFFIVLGWVLLVPSAVAALGAAWLLATSMEMGGETRTAPGRVVAHQDRVVGPSTRRSFGQQSIVEFTARDGSTVRFTDPLVRRNQAVHDIGEKVTVRYSADKPSEAVVASSRTVSLVIGAVILFFSVICMVVGWLLLRFGPKAVRLSAPSDKPSSD